MNIIILIIIFVCTKKVEQSCELWLLSNLHDSDKAYIGAAIEAGLGHYAS